MAEVIEATREQVREVLERAIQEVNASLSNPIPSNAPDDTTLYGREGVLDSLALVTLLSSLEEGIEDTFGLSFTLADERAMSQTRSPFRTIGSLTDYVMLLIQEHNAQV
jgi:acyl carrier protein